MNLPIDLRTLRSAGRRRYKTSVEIAEYIDGLSPTEWACAKDIFERQLPPMGGGSQQVIFATAAATALTTAQVTFLGPLYGIPQAPLVLCIAYIPQMASATAAKTITVQMRRTDTPAVISNFVKLTATADTNPGPFTLIGVLPLPSTTTTAVQLPAGYGIDVQGADTGSSAVPTGSATAPMILGAFGMH